MAKVVTLKDLFTNEILGTIRVLPEYTLQQVKDRIVAKLFYNTEIVLPELLALFVRDGMPPHEQVQVNRPELRVLVNTPEYVVKPEINVLYSTFTRSGLVHQDTIYIRNGFKHDLSSLQEIGVLRQELSKVYGEITLFELERIVRYKVRNEDPGDVIETKIQTAIRRVKTQAQKETALDKLLSKAPPIPKVNNNNQASVYPFHLTSVVLQFKNPKIELDLEQLFGAIEATPEIPFMALRSPGEPYIKVSKEFQTSVKNSNKLLKEWMFSADNNKLSMPKGLRLKILHVPRYSPSAVPSSSSYLSVNVFENGTLTLRCSWNSEENAGVQEIRDCVASLVPLVRQINANPIVFVGIDATPTSPRTIAFPTFEKAIVSTTDSVFRVPLTAPLPGTTQIQNKIEQSPLVKSIFEPKPSSTQDMTILQFVNLPRILPDETLLQNVSITVREKENDLVAVSLFGAKTIGQTQGVYEYFVAVLEHLFPGLVSTRRVDKGGTSKEPVSMKALRMLKSYQIPVDSRSCQKPRQPVVDDNEELPLLAPDAYRYNYRVMATGKTHKLICANRNSKYIYPGITKSGVPCCFLKPQSRPEFDDMVRDSLPFQEDDQFKTQVVNNTVIVTTKILDPGRIGVLSPQLKQLFQTVSKLPPSRRGRDLLDGANTGPDSPPPIYRFGVPEDPDSFFSCVRFYIANEGVSAVPTVRKLKENLVSFLVESDVYQTLDVSADISKSDYIDLLMNFSTSIPVQVLAQLVSEYLGVRIYIFTEEPEGVLCSYSGPASASKTMFLFYHSRDKNKATVYGHYEPLVYYDTTTTTGLQSVFTQKHFPKTLDLVELLYKFSCKKRKEIQQGGETQQPSIQDLVQNPRLREEIKYQVLNPFGEVLFVVYAFGSGNGIGLVPVKPTKPVMGIQTIGTRVAFRTFKQGLVESVNNLYKIANAAGGNESGLLPRYQILSSERFARAVVTTSGLVLPVLESPKSNELEPVSMQYVEDIDYLLASQNTYQDHRIKIIDKYILKVLTVSQARIEVARHLTQIEPELAKEMIKVIENPRLDKDAKREYVMERIQEILGQVIGSPRQNKAVGTRNPIEIEANMPVKRLAVSDITLAQECTKNPAADWYTDNSLLNGQCRFSVPNEFHFADTVEIITNEILSDSTRKLLFGKISLATLPGSGGAAVTPARVQVGESEVLLSTFEEALEFVS